MHLLIDGSVKGQYITIIPTLFFKMSTCGHFPHALLHPPHTQILQIMLKDHNSKNTITGYYNNSKNNAILIRRQPFHYVTLALANYYLNLFHTILCAVGYPDMHVSKYNTDASFILQKHNRALCNSLKNLKTIKRPYSGPRSWSQT